MKLYIRGRRGHSEKKVRIGIVLKERERQRVPKEKKKNKEGVEFAD